MKKFYCYLFISFAALFGLVESSFTANLEDIQKQRSQQAKSVVRNIITIECGRVLKGQDVMPFIEGVTVGGDEYKRQIRQIDVLVASEFSKVKEGMLKGEMPDFLKEQAGKDLARILQDDNDFFKNILKEFEEILFRKLELKAKELCIKEGEDFWQETQDVMEIIEKSLIHDGVFRFDEEVASIKAVYDAWLVREAMKIIVNDEKFKTSYREILATWCKRFYGRTCWFLRGVKSCSVIAYAFAHRVTDWILACEEENDEIEDINKEESILAKEPSLLLLEGPRQEGEIPQDVD